MNFRKFSHILLYALFLLNFQCFEDDANTDLPDNCGTFALIDSGTFQNGATSLYSIIGVDITDDCMSINFSATGCDGSTWIMQLIDSGEVQETSPPQRSIKLFLINDEACLAEISAVQIFDLSTLRVEGESEIILNLEGFDEPITYTY
ncbi:hypothetical protein [Winogradskyella sp.]|uniref:hypothetical protein n=1 Tax=Winogradskyella sp. TaxID=1883156 RepID=UPI002638B1B7|nr:hypothetical protein [Winogradskyella sp.]